MVRAWSGSGKLSYQLSSLDLNPIAASSDIRSYDLGRLNDSLVISFMITRNSETALNTKPLNIGNGSRPWGYFTQISP